ncbi:MAG: NDP-hexose 2,3-dehydratase family protein [Actinomycetia bacterium]|nr:NDP-hexose 2,3-dehydratase family protein [Actinomycetes bacterium]
MTNRQLRNEYTDSLSQYRDNLTLLGYEVDDIRSEHHLECMQDWSQFRTLDEIHQWFLERRRATTMGVEDIPLREARGWTINSETGDICHESGDFFTVHGIRVRQTATREVGGGGWDQPILEQVGYDGGLLGIVRKRFDGVPHYLIEAKAEPGNYEIIQMSPTLQATFSNLRRAHGGRKPRFAEVFEEPDSVGATVLYAQWLSEDGGRLHKKRNFGMLVEVPTSFKPDLTDDFAWMSMYQIKACLNENAWVNPHIRGIIAHL